MTKTAFTKLIAAILAGAMMTLGLLSCGMTVRATDLMEGIEAAEASGKAADDTFISALADFSIRLYQQSSADCSKGEIRISVFRAFPAFLESSPHGIDFCNAATARCPVK